MFSHATEIEFLLGTVDLRAASKLRSFLLLIVKRRLLFAAMPLYLILTGMLTASKSKN